MRLLAYMTIPGLAAYLDDPDDVVSWTTPTEYGHLWAVWTGEWDVEETVAAATAQVRARQDAAVAAWRAS